MSGNEREEALPDGRVFSFFTYVKNYYYSYKN